MSGAVRLLGWRADFERRSLLREPVWDEIFLSVLLFRIPDSLSNNRDYCDDYLSFVSILYKFDFIRKRIQSILPMMYNPHFTKMSDLPFHFEIVGMIERQFSPVDPSILLPAGAPPTILWFPEKERKKEEEEKKKRTPTPLESIQSTVSRAKLEEVLVPLTRILWRDHWMQGHRGTRMSVRHERSRVTTSVLITIPRSNSFVARARVI